MSLQTSRQTGKAYRDRMVARQLRAAGSPSHGAPHHPRPQQRQRPGRPMVVHRAAPPRPRPHPVEGPHRPHTPPVTTARTPPCRPPSAGRTGLVADNDPAGAALQPPGRRADGGAAQASAAARAARPSAVGSAWSPRLPSVGTTTPTRPCFHKLSETPHQAICRSVHAAWKGGFSSIPAQPGDDGRVNSTAEHTHRIGQPTWTARGPGVLSVPRDPSKQRGARHLRENLLLQSPPQEKYP